MKRITTKAISMILILTMLMSTMVFFASASELGEYDNPYKLSTYDMTRLAVPVPAEGEVWIQVNDANGTVMTIGYASSSEYMVNYRRMTYYPEGDGTLSLTMNPGADSFSIYNPSSEIVNVYMVLVPCDDVRFDGTMDNPQKVDLGTHTAEIKAGTDGYYYEWTATEEGKLKVAMETAQCANGWQFKVNNITKNKYGETHTSYDKPAVDSEEVPVSAGDQVIVNVGTFNFRDVFNMPAGSVAVTLSFTSGTTGGDSGDEGGNGDGDFGEEEVEANYFESEATLELGEKEYELSAEYDYTVFVFKPAEIGEYKFTSSNSKLGIVGYFWVNGNPNETTVPSGDFTWKCTSVGQTIYVAVKGDAEKAAIKITKDELVIEEGVQWTIYENKVTPAPFKYSGDVSKLDYVDTFDSKVDKAVLGDDGYYHLNAANGPVLYANLSDELMDLYDASTYGQLKYVGYENGEVVLKIDYNKAFTEYYECVDEENAYYPLTVDIMEFFKMVGASQNWYGEKGWVGGNEEDAWMFACYYNEAETTISNDSANKNPQTGDNMLAVIAIMTFSAMTCATVTIIRKRREY